MQALSFEKLPPEQQALAKECGRDVLGMEDVRGSIASCKPPAPPADVLVLPGAGRLGCAGILGCAGYLALCGAPAATTGEVIFCFPPLCVIQTLVTLSSAMGQVLRFSMPALSQAVNDESPRVCTILWGPP